jgi:IMP cyclohydrolase
MDGANFEPDSLQTPRIAGVITSNNNKPVYIISIKTAGKPAFTWQVKPELGTIIGVATFHGNMESPEAFNTDNGPAILKCSAVTPQEMTDFIYEISAATHQGDDIRVCTIGGIRGEDNIWTMALLNKHKS